MKSFKKLAAFVAAAAICTSLPFLLHLKADAEESTTYYVKYDTDYREWRMQTGVEKWNDEDPGQDLYYLNNGDNPVKNGGVVVVLPNDDDATGNQEININARLSNLTVNRSDVVIHTGGIDNCYILGGSYAAINGDVSNAYVYDDAVCTFNNNVTNLNLIASDSNTVDSSVSVKGTVAYAATKNPGGVIDEYYNFAADSFFFDAENDLRTDDSLYSKTGNGAVATTTTPADTQTSTAATGTTTTTTTATTTAASDSGYDDVPKTGENNDLAILLLACSAISFAGCLAFRKKPQFK